MKTPHPNDLLQAEKQVLTGVFVRLLKRYARRFPADEAKALAGAVTGRIFCIDPGDDAAKAFMDARRDLVDEEVSRIAKDDEIRRIATDTIVLKAVFMHRQRGCRDDAYMGPVEHLKRIGIFLEGETAPSPAAYIEKAREFYDSSPW